MNGLGGLNKSSNRIVIGLLRPALPDIATRHDIAGLAARKVATVGKAQRGLSTFVAMW